MKRMLICDTKQHLAVTNINNVLFKLVCKLIIQMTKEPEEKAAWKNIKNSFHTKKHLIILL